MNKELFDLITPEEKTTMEDYIESFAISNGTITDRASLSHIMRFWNRNKVFLSKMFGDKLILEKEVTFTAPYLSLIDAIDRAHTNRNSEMYRFYNAYCNWIFDFKLIHPEQFEGEYPTDLFWALKDLVRPSVLVDNVYHCRETAFLFTDDGKKIAIQDGCKPLRILKKIADTFNIEGFEEYRLMHSQILNQKEKHGTLCLSIHPLDYMTMSDNECDWSSCMSWRDEGCYRRGTVEMMNSDCVVVGYLKAKENMTIYNHEWNNKKWRSLFVVTPEAITSVKAYPYQAEDLSKCCLDWLKELMETNTNHSYKDVLYDYNGEEVNDENGNFVANMYYSTGDMYNDFGCCDHWMYASTNENLDDLNICYSGETECMWCGGLHNFFDDDEAECLVCEECTGVAICDYCGDHCHPDDMAEIDGYELCRNCMYDNTTWDEILHEDHLNQNMQMIVLDLYPATHINSLRCNPGIYTSLDVYLEEDTFLEYFPNADFNNLPTAHSGMWSDIDRYYVTIEQCSDKGLKLFGYNSREEAEHRRDFLRKEYEIDIAAEKIH